MFVYWPNMANIFIDTKIFVSVPFLLYGGPSLSCWYLYIKDTFKLNLKVRDSLSFKTEIDFEFSVKVKIVCILK